MDDRLTFCNLLLFKSTTSRERSSLGFVISPRQHDLYDLPRITPSPGTHNATRVNNHGMALLILFLCLAILWPMWKLCSAQGSTLESICRYQSVAQLIAGLSQSNSPQARAKKNIQHGTDECVLLKAGGSRLFVQGAPRLLIPRGNPRQCVANVDVR